MCIVLRGQISLQCSINRSKREHQRSQGNKGKILQEKVGAPAGVPVGVHRREWQAVAETAVAGAAARRNNRQNSRRSSRRMATGAAAGWSQEQWWERRAEGHRLRGSGGGTGGVSSRALVGALMRGREASCRSVMGQLWGHRAAAGRQTDVGASWGQQSGVFSGANSRVIQGEHLAGGQQ
jgi:hypothetical protein